MKRISRRKFIQISAAATAGAVMAACAPEETPTPEAEEPTATPKPEEPTATPEAEAGPWPREEVARERTLIRMFGGSGGEFGNVGIAGPYCTGFTHQHSDASQMEFLFYYTALNGKFIPWLAESYEYNEDATEMTVHIRKGIKWNDGEPFTAHDVAFTYNYLMEHAPDIRDSTFVKDRTDKVEAVDDYTVKFTFPKTNWRYHFTHCTCRFDRGIYLLPEHIYKDVDAPLEFEYWDVEKGWPVYTGPYQLTKFEATVKHFDRRYEWWAYETGLIDHMPEPERVTHLPFTSDTLAAEMIINDEVDHTLDLRPRTIESILEQAPDHVTSYTGQEKPYGYVDWWPISMYFNNLEEPYDDPKVRWAMAYAIDQRKVNEVGWGGAGRHSMGPYPRYPRLMGYYENASDKVKEYQEEVLKQDLDKVEELMTEAGFSKDDEGFWVDGEGNRPDADVYAGVPLFGDIAPVTAELLHKAGFDSKHVAPPDVWEAKSNGKALLHFFGHGGSVWDPYYTLQMYLSKWQKPTGENCGLNRPRWANEDYDAIVEEMSSTPPDDEEKMQELFSQAMEIWYEELPEVPLVQWFHRIPLNLTYWENWPTEDNPYNSALWHITMPVTLWNIKAVK